MGEAEKHEHVAAAEILVGDGLAVFADKLEGTADKRLAARRHAVVLHVGVENENAGADERTEKKAADNDQEKRTSHRIHSPSCSSVPLIRARLRNQLNVA